MKKRSSAHQLLIFAKEALRDLSRDFSRCRSSGLQIFWHFVQNVFFLHSDFSPFYSRKTSEVFWVRECYVKWSKLLHWQLCLRKKKKIKLTKNHFAPKPWKELQELNCSFIDLLDCSLEVYTKTFLWKNLKDNCCFDISYQLLQCCWGSFQSLSESTGCRAELCLPPTLMTPKF